MKIVKYMHLSLIFLPNIKYSRVMFIISIKIMIMLLAKVIKNVHQLKMIKCIIINTNLVLMLKIFRKSMVDKDKGKSKGKDKDKDNRGNIQRVEVRVIPQIFLKEKNKWLERQLAFKQNLLIKNQLLMVLVQEVKWIISVVQVLVKMIKIY